MADPVKNFAYGTLDSTGMSSGATSFTFTTGHGARFPATSLGAYNVVVYDKIYGSAAVAYQAGKAEIIRIVTRSGDTVSSCTRAQESTTALDFNNPLKIYKVELDLTAKTLTDIAGTAETFFQTGAPDSSVGKNGDMAVDDNNSLYVKDSGSWVLVVDNS